MAEGVKWYRKAAEQGSSDAQCSLGGCYRFGEGVDVDMVQGVKWYQKVAEQGDGDSMEELGHIATVMDLLCLYGVMELPNCGAGVIKNKTKNLHFLHARHMWRHDKKCL